MRACLNINLKHMCAQCSGAESVIRPNRAVFDRLLRQRCLCYTSPVGLLLTDTLTDTAGGNIVRHINAENHKDLLRFQQRRVEVIIQALVSPPSSHHILSLTEKEGCLSDLKYK